MSIETKKEALTEISASTFSTAFSFPAAATNAPQSSAALGVATFACERKNRLSVFYAGTADGGTFTRNIVGWQHTLGANGVSSFVPVKIGSGQGTMGATVLGSAAAGVESATAVWADTLVDDGNSPHLQVVSPENDLVGEDIIDVSRYEFVSVYVTNNSGSAATMTVLGSIYEARGGGFGASSGEAAESPVEKTIVEANQMVAVPTTSEAIVGSRTLIRAIWFQAKRANAANTGNVYLNDTDGVIFGDIPV